MRKDGDVVKENNSSQSGSVLTNDPDQAVNNEDITTDKSASARKLENVTLGAPKTPKIDEVTTRQSTQLEEQGYRIVYIQNIRKTVESMHKCKNGILIACEDASKRAGLSSIAITLSVQSVSPFVNKLHHLDPVFLEFLTPLFDRLSEKKLLKRCLPGLSENVNESVNSLVWNRCPKHRNRGVKSVETAAASAIMQFNIGATGRHGVMKELEIPAAFYTKAGSGRKNEKRVKQANRRVQKKFKAGRQKIRQAKLVEEARLKALEGVTYESAAFNEDCLSSSSKRKRKIGKTNIKEANSKVPRKK